MTKKKKSILSDQRFVVLLVIIALSAVFSFMSKEFRQYTTILSMLDFSYYDLLMAIGVTFPLITGGVDLSTLCIYYKLILSHFLIFVNDILCKKYKKCVESCKIFLYVLMLPCFFCFSYTFRGIRSIIASLTADFRKVAETGLICT